MTLILRGKMSLRVSSLLASPSNQHTPQFQLYHFTVMALHILFPTLQRFPSYVQPVQIDSAITVGATELMTYSKQPYSLVVYST